MMTDREQRKLAEAVRDACVETALIAYEDAAIRGICHEGAWECAVGAMRSIDLDALLERCETEGDERSI